MTEGGNRFFVDTNILLYCHDSRAPEKQRTAEYWIDNLWRMGAARLSWQVLNEFLVNATRRIGISLASARSAAEMYFEWQPLDFTAEVLRRAWYWTDRAGVNYWDALILAAAERSGCHWLLSEDFQAGRRYGAVEIVNPFDADPERFFPKDDRR